MESTLHKEIKIALEESVRVLFITVKQQLQQENVVIDLCRKFLWEYANKQTEKQGEQLYYQSLCELILFKAILSPTANTSLNSDLLETYFSGALTLALEKPSFKKLINEIEVYFSTIYQQEEERIGLEEYFLSCFHYSLTPEWYPNKYFNQKKYSKSLHSIISNIKQKNLGNTQIEVIDAFSNHIKLKNSLLPSENTSIYFKSFPHYLIGLAQQSENLFWLDPLKEYSFVLPPQMDIFSVNKLQESLIAQGTKQVDLIVNDLRGNPSLFTKTNSKKITSRIKNTYLEHDFNSAANTDAILKIFRWCADRVKQNGSLLFLVESEVITSETYSSLRKTLEQEFNYIILLEIEEEGKSFYILLLKEKN